MDTKKMRKELVIGLAILAVWLVLKIFPRGGFLMGLLLVVGLVLAVVGALPDSLYQQVKKVKDQIFAGTKK